MIRTHKRVLAIAATTATAGIALTGCSAGGGGDSAGGGDKPTVAVVTPESTGEFYGAMYCGAQDAADEAGITLNIQGTPEVTTDAEMAVLQAVLATDPDGLLLAVWDNTAFNETLSTYDRPIIMPDSFLSNDAHIASVRTDNYQSSYDAALKIVEEFGVDSGKVFIVTADPGNQVQTARAEGFRDAVEEHTDLEALEFAYVGGDAAKASQAVTSAIAANPDISIVFTTNGAAGTGSISGVASSGSDALSVGFDTASSQVEELRSGGYDALIAQSPYQMGYDSMEMMAQILDGSLKPEDIEEKDIWSPWAVVTADNVDDEETKPFLMTSDCG